MIKKKQKPLIVYLWLAFNLLDTIITYIGIQAGFREGNPIYRWLMAQFGLLPALGVKMGMVLIIITFIRLLARRWEGAWGVLRTANVIVCMAMIWNMIMITA